MYASNVMSVGKITRFVSSGRRIPIGISVGNLTPFTVICTVVGCEGIKYFLPEFGDAPILVMSTATSESPEGYLPFMAVSGCCVVGFIGVIALIIKSAGHASVSSVAPLQLSSILFPQISVGVGVPGVQVCSCPFAHLFTVFMQAPVPQVFFPSSVCPLQLSSMLLHVSVCGVPGMHFIFCLFMQLFCIVLVQIPFPQVVGALG